MKDFVHLHTHSHYSLLEAIPKISELVAAAKKDGHEALALTDHGNLYGAIDFYKECKDQKIKPIIGVDFHLAPRTRFDKEHRVDEPVSRLVLLAKNEEGYKNLILLVTKAHLEGFYERPRVDRELLETHRGGLVAILPSHAGEHAYALRHADHVRAQLAFHWYKKVYGDDCFAEITHHPEIEGHDARMQGIITAAKKANMPILAAHDVYYLSMDDALASDLVNKIRTGGVLSRDAVAEPRDFSFIARERIAELFKNEPEAIENTAKVAQMCHLDLKLGKWVFPDFPIPPGSSATKELRALAQAGFAQRGVEESKENLERVEYEMSVIGKKGYSPYFLVVADLLRHARKEGIVTNTRGSAAGSLVSYLCGITTVNPLAYNLPFERFLNPERPSPPDIDMDLADNRRDELIEYVRGKYGADKVAQIGTFGTMMARAAVRDVARALGHPYGLGDRIAKLIPFGKQGFPVSIAGSLEEVPELAQIYKADADVREVLDLAQKIEGNARHVGVHAAGVVISPTPLSDFVPVQFDPKGGKIITQYDMYAVEDAGLLKFDFLGLTNLSVLADSVARVRERLGTQIDLEKIPLDDQKTFEMLSRGETLGVFQLAGGGMTAYLVDLKPSSIHDINAMVALYRPGPMAFIPHYIERKKNPRLVKYLDPRMEPILKHSHGIIVYQDDVLMIARELAGYSWLEADKLRKAMGKKIPAEMAAQKEHFTEGCIARGMKKDAVQKLWEQIETFAAYGFGKAHAASYGNLAYKTAYMKANFPVDYMAALLTAEAGDVEKIAEVVNECKRMGITVWPPSVNESKGNFTVIHPEHGRGVIHPEHGRGADDNPSTHSTSPPQASGGQGDIRFGMYSIKNFGTGVADTIIAAVEKDGAFTDLADFLARIEDKNLNKKQLEALIKSGALDQFGERGLLLANIDLLLAFHREHAKASPDQSSLFSASALGNGARAKLRLPPAPEAPLEERLAWEKDLLGLYVSGHPLDKHRAKFNDPRKTIRHAKEHLHGVETVIAGFIEQGRINMTKGGERMGFFRIADFSDAIEIVAFPRVFKEYEKLMAIGSCIAIKGRISDRNGEVSFVIERAKAL